MDKDSFFSLRGGLQGAVSTSEVIYYGGSSGKVSLDSVWVSQLISELKFFHNQLPGLLVTITKEFSFLGLNEITGYRFM